MNKKIFYVFGVVIAIFVVISVVMSGNNSNNIVIDEEISSEEGYKGLISANEFSDLIDTGEYIVLDIRTKGEYDQGYISENPLLIDYYEEDFKIELNKLDKEKKYLIYCNSGNRSSYTVPIMNRYGFTEFYELEGGITAWNNAGLETY